MKQSDEIRKFFDKSVSDIAQQHKQMTAEIKEWREKLVRDIGKHADKIRNDLDIEFKKKKQIITDQCEKFIKRAAVEEKKKAVESLQQIRDEWQNLEFKLNELQHHKHEVEYISGVETDSEGRSNESKRLSVDQSSVNNQATNGTDDNGMDRNSPSAVNKEIKLVQSSDNYFGFIAFLFKERK